MPLSYVIDEARGLLVGRASGTVTVQDLIDAFDDMVKETKGVGLFIPHLMLADEHTSMHNLSFDGFLRVKDSIEAWRRLYPGGNAKVAVVASRKMHGAVAKMMQATTEMYPAMGATVELFGAEEAAVAWLKS
jgi:hypothetical protein